MFYVALKEITITKRSHFRFEAQFLPFSQVQSTSSGSFPEQRLVIKPISFQVVSFRGQIKMSKPRPDYSPLGVKFKFSDKHPRPFRDQHTGNSPLPCKKAVITLPQITIPLTSFYISLRENLQ